MKLLPCGLNTTKQYNDHVLPLDTHDPGSSQTTLRDQRLSRRLVPPSSAILNHIISGSEVRFLRPNSSVPLNARPRCPAPPPSLPSVEKNFDMVYGSTASIRRKSRYTNKRF